MKEYHPLPKFYERLRLLMCAMVLLLVVASFGKKEANSVEITNDPAPSSTERQPVAAQPDRAIGRYCDLRLSQDGEPHH